MRQSLNVNDRVGDPLGRLGTLTAVPSESGTVGLVQWDDEPGQAVPVSLADLKPLVIVCVRLEGTFAYRTRYVSELRSCRLTDPVYLAWAYRTPTLDAVLALESDGYAVLIEDAIGNPPCRYRIVRAVEHHTITTEPVA